MILIMVCWLYSSIKCGYFLILEQDILEDEAGRNRKEEGPSLVESVGAALWALSKGSAVASNLIDDQMALSYVMVVCVFEGKDDWWAVAS